MTFLLFKIMKSGIQGKDLAAGDRHGVINEVVPGHKNHSIGASPFLSKTAAKASIKSIRRSDMVLSPGKSILIVTGWRVFFGVFPWLTGSAIKNYICRSYEADPSGPGNES